MKTITHDEQTAASVAEAPSEYPPLPGAYATAHDDGHWTMPRGCEPYESLYAGWKESVYSEAQMRAYVDADRKVRQMMACNFCLDQAREAMAAAAPSAATARQQAVSEIHAIEGTVKFRRSSSIEGYDGHKCACCPDGDHVFARRVQWDEYQTDRPDHFGSSANVFVDSRITDYRENEGKRVRLTLQLISDGTPQQAVLADAPSTVEGDTWYAVLAPNGEEGVIFQSKRDARWTSDGVMRSGFGYPTIGGAFRETYEDDAKKFVIIEFRAMLKAAPGVSK